MTNLLERAELRKETFYKLTNSADVPEAPNGNRNLALGTSGDWSNGLTSFSGINNQTVVIYKICNKGLKVGDKINARIVIKYSDIVVVEGKTARINLQSEGNVTHWDSGSLNVGGAVYPNGEDDEVVLTAVTPVTENHLKNDYWYWRLRVDYVTSGKIQWKEAKAEISETATPYSAAPEDLGWSTDTLVPTQSNRYLWKFEYVYYSDGGVEITSPVNLSIAGANGATGPQGPKGDQGIQGPQGPDGRTQYTHIAYADNDKGGGFSQTDQTKAYIGMYVDFTATDSNDITKYKWTKWKGSDGAQGIPGPKGADGKTPYIHFAYADDDKGTNFSLTDKNQQYQGYYSDYTEADSTDYTKYKWVDRLANVQVSTKNLILKSNDLANPHQQSGANTTVTSTDDYFVIKSTGYTANAWGGMSWNMSISEVTAGEEFSILMPVYIDSSITLDNGWNFSIKNHSTNSAAYNYSIPVTKKDEWFNVAITFKITKDVTFGTYPFYVYLVKNGLVRIKPPMLVRGNAIPSDYVVAPEDIQADIDNKADSVLTQEQLNALAEQNNIVKAEMEAKASIDTVNQWITAYQNYVNANNEARAGSEKNLQEATARILQLKTDVGDLRQQWDFIDTYMSIQNEGLIIGKSDGSAFAKFANDRISLFSGSNEVMYISQGTLHIENGIFTKTIQIGRFRFETHPADQDMLVLRDLGG